MNVLLHVRPTVALALVLAFAQAPAQAAPRSPAQTQPQSPPATFTLSGAFGGTVVDLASRGGRAVALVGHRLEVLDAQGGTMGTLAMSPPLPGQPASVVLSDDGSTAYVAAGTEGVFVVDVAAAPIVPAAPGAMDTPAIAPIVARLAPPAPDDPFKTPRGVRGIAVAGGTLYAVGERRLELYDIAVPGRPAALSSLGLDGEFYSVAAADWGAALLGNPASGAANVRLVDAADRHRPLLGGGARVELDEGDSSAIGAVAVQGRTVFVTGARASGWIDATVPSAPRVHDLPLVVIDLEVAPDRPDHAVAIRRSILTGAMELVWLDLTNPAAPRALAQTDVHPDVRRVALVDAAERAAVADDPAGLALYRRVADLTLQRVAVAERVGRVQNAAALDAAHVVALTNERLSVIRRADGVVVAEARLDNSSGGEVWFDVVTDQGWAYISGASNSQHFTPIDLRQPTTPVEHNPFASVQRRIEALSAAPGWIGALTESAAYVWSTSSEGIGSIWREVSLAAPSSAPASMALTARGLVLSDARGVRAIDPADRSPGRALTPRTDNDGLPWTVVAASDTWFLTYRFAVGLTVHRMDEAAGPPRLIPGTRDYERAFIDGDRAVVLGQGDVGADAGQPSMPALAAIDLAGASVIARSVAVGYNLRLVNLGQHDGQAEAGTISTNGALLMWHAVDVVPATPTPLPSATRPTPTDAPPPSGPTIYLPYAVAYRTAAKPPVTLRPTARLGGFADGVAVDGQIVWLRERGTLTAVDIESAALRPLGSVEVCAPDTCPREPFAVSGGRLAVNDGEGGVRIVDVTDPLRPRLGGRILDDSMRLPGFAVAAPWPGRPLFLLSRRVYDPSALWNDDATDLHVIDATDADEPRTVRTIRRLEPIGPIVAANGYVYAVGIGLDAPQEDVEVQVWSLTEDGDLSVVGRADAIGESLAFEVAQEEARAVASEKRLFVVTRDIRFAAFDLYDPRRPVPILPPDLQGELDGARLPLNPFELSSAHALGDTLVVTLPRVRAVIGVPALDADVPFAVIEVPFLGEPSSWSGRGLAGAMAVAGDRLVVAGGGFGGLTIIDGLYAPKPRLTTLRSIGAVGGLARDASNGNTLLTTASGDVLNRVDLAAPERVTTSGRALTAALSREGQGWDWFPDVDLAVDGAAVWAAGNEFVLTGFDLGTGAEPRAVPNSGRTEGLPAGSGRIGVALIAGMRLAVTAHALRGIEVWDVSEGSGPPQAVTRFSTGGAPEDVVLDGRRAYVADGPGGIAALDVRNPASPQEVGRLHLPGSTVRLAFDAGRSILWTAIEQRPDSRWPLTGLGGGRFPSAIVAVEVGADGTLRPRGVVGLPVTRIRDIALRADLVLVSGGLHDNPWTGPLAFASHQQTNMLLALDADPASPSVRGEWRDRPFSRASGGLVVLPDGRVVLAAGEDGLRVFEIDEGGE